MPRACRISSGWRSRACCDNPLSEYERRLTSEIEMIQKMRYEGYFLIVWDFIHYARAQDVPVGPGRGSAAGSLVSYALRITDVDPLQYNLLFERFLNPERVSMPDIDIDFCMRRRGELIEYVTQKYGRENVAQIITFGTMAAKAAVKDVGRAMDIPYGEVDRLAKLIPTTLGIELEDALVAGAATQIGDQQRRAAERFDGRGAAAGRTVAARFDACGRCGHLAAAAHGRRAGLQDEPR